jgi:hypothetical protein
VRLTDLSFEQWIEHAFSREVRHQRNPWFFDPDPDRWDPIPVQAVDYLARLFEEPDRHLEWFTDAQIAQGLTYLVSTSASGDNGWLYSTEAPTADRLHCIEATASLFEKLFAPRCTPTLSHLSESGGPLNGVCYMWWDEFPCVALAVDPDRNTLHTAVLRTLDRILRMPSLPCQESALHGLGHWQQEYSGEVQRIIDDYEAKPQDAKLHLYAQSARSGGVL